VTQKESRLNDGLAFHVHIKEQHTVIVIVS